MSDPSPEPEPPAPEPPAPPAPPAQPAPARRPTHLVLSGGGLAGISYAGALKFISESGIGADIRHVSGTSMGAWFATAFALGIPAAELETMAHHVFSDPDYVRYEPTALLGLMSTYGLDDGHRFVKPLEPYMAAVALAPEELQKSAAAKMTFREHAGAPATTFRDIRERFGRTLVVVATCLETGEAVYFGPDTTPEVSVLDAVRASMAIPFVIRPVSIAGSNYIDGAFTDNTPFAPFLSAPAPDPPPLFMVFDIRQRAPSSALPKYPCGNVIEFVTLLITLASKNIRLVSPTADEIAEQIGGTRPILMDACPMPVMRLACDAAGIYFLIHDTDIADSIEYGHDRAKAWWDAREAEALTGAS
jgi:predicted acylesterase/phospholipase RssA